MSRIKHVGEYINEHICECVEETEVITIDSRDFEEPGEYVPVFRITQICATCRKPFSYTHLYQKV